MNIENIPHVVAACCILHSICEIHGVCDKRCISYTFQQLMYACKLIHYYGPLLVPYTFKLFNTVLLCTCMHVLYLDHKTVNNHQQSTKRAY